MLSSPKNKIDVALRPCSGYEPNLLPEKIELLMSTLSWRIPRGAKVLLKPNLVAAPRPDRPACTDGRFIAAVASWLVDHGAQVALGDSPAFGSAREVARRAGILQELKNLPVSILDFQRKKRLTLPSCGKITVAADLFEYDLLINLPKLKAHNQMGLTLALKNLFGAVLGYRKALAHMRYGDRDNIFCAMIVDLARELPVTLNLLDGICAMHREGPMGGPPFAANILGASRSAAALDTAIYEALGLSPERLPLWSECQRRRLPGSRLNELNFPLSAPNDLPLQGFEIPATLAPIRFSCRGFLQNSLIKIINLCKKKANAGM